MDPTAHPLLEFHEISKAFFGIPVLRNITLSLQRGQVLGLVGENGAGKSTLMNILGGVLPADAGRMRLDGHDYAPRTSRDAARAGIAFIHQELNLFGNLSIAENLCLPVFPRRRVAGIPLPLIDGPAMRRRARELLAAVELDHPPTRAVEALSPGERQLVEIAKAIGADARLIILDEPTTSLTSREAQRLFNLIARLRRQGVAMIYISHHLEEVLRLCDNIIVLRDGQVVDQGPAAGFTPDRLISRMVGRSIDQLYPARAAAPAGEVLLEARDVARRPAVRGVSFSLHRGEVLGVAGLMGAGRTELARLLFGLDSLDRGEVHVEGKRLRPDPRQSIARRMSLLTENRREEGLLLDASLHENIALVSLPAFAVPAVGWLKRRRLKEQVASAADSVRLGAVAAERQVARTLSGGNQQKVVLAKWLLTGPSVFILDEPTRGIDVGAKHEVYKIINALAERGAGVLLISSEIEELIGLCDRILVMGAGRLRDQIPRSEFDRERILRAALAAGEVT